MVNKTVLAMCMATALLAGCKAKDTAAEAAPEAATAAAPEATAAPEPAPEATPAAPAATAAAVAFDISKIPVSDKPLPAWPYVALAAGYHYDNNENLAEQSKDLARVPAWTGSQLLWVEGKTFSDQIDNSGTITVITPADGDYYSVGIAFETMAQQDATANGLTIRNSGTIRADQTK